MLTIQLCTIIWQYCCFSIFYQLNAALVSIRGLFSETYTQNINYSKHFFLSDTYCILYSDLCFSSNNILHGACYIHI